MPLQSIVVAVESGYQWKSDRGLVIAKVAIVSIEYDENTREILKTVQRADALAGSRGNSNLQASVAAGIQAAGENGGAGGLMGVGATLVPGGSDGLILIGMPLLWPYAWIAFASMCITIYIATLLAQPNATQTRDAVPRR